MKLLRNILVVVSAFALGLCTGRRLWTDHAPTLPDHLPAQNNERQSVPAAVPLAKIQAPSPATNQPISTKTRLEVLASLGHQPNVWGGGFRCHPIDRFDGCKINAEFAFIFGLSAPEVQRLNQTIARTEAQVMEMQRTALQAGFDEKSGVLSIEVPSLPKKGGAVYDQLLAEMKTVLGDERSQYFDLMAGDSFDAAFSHFGLAAQQMTVKLSTTSPRACHELSSTVLRGERE